MMHVVVYWVICILLSVSVADHSLGVNENANMTVTGSCIDKERQALLKFKRDLKDINGTLNNWSNEEGKMDCCKWSGVSCDTDTGHVTGLSLYKYYLVGKISTSIKVLKQLQVLILCYNDFQSSDIPNFLGSLTNLQYLDMCNANLSGPIPQELGNLSNLSYLDLNSNSLRGSIPASFEGLASLIELDLSINNLGGFIPQIQSLYNLSSLNLSGNSLCGSIPFSFGSLTSLIMLDLSHNQLSGDLPNSLGQLSGLDTLDVSSNSLHGVISDLHFINLSLLTHLDMSFNSFSFNFSSHFRIPVDLETIKLQSCKLGPRFPVWIKSQRYFRYLDISSAGISDSVPVWFWDQLPLILKFLNLSSNELRGTLPDITSDFEYYPGLDLSNNRFEGRVPLLPSKLASLNLSGNKFQGNLSFLCRIDGELTFIDLSNNSFSGSLSDDCWSQFQKLVILDLSNNNLSGKIPLSFRLLSQLEALYLRKNAFVGELPMSLSNCTNLRFLDLGENKLSGKIPAWVGERLTRLYVLVLRSNIFNGSLPTQMCLLNNLNILDLSNNGLVGNIPGCFGNFTSMFSKKSGDDMAYHSYHAYHFSSGPGHVFTSDPAFGEVLESFVDNALVAWKGIERSFGTSILELLKIIDLSNNRLSGEFPFEIARLVELVSLNISLNKLHGELPKDIGNLTSLNSLDLSRNQFSGKIPSSLSQLNGLGVLDLSYNNLSGKIPTGTLLQGFNSSSYEGNPLLYGPPITPISRPTPATTIDDEVDTNLHGDDDFWKSYYMGMGSGFAVGFWGICGLIFLNHRCRHLLFASLSLAKDWIYVTVVVIFRKFKRFLASLHS
ncbi:receptor-like protein EIX2 [Rutidosis leptorrhynchoides]|uniref:receptor-like protein EIX2 n=1 Tax=Rutidosis leptorrhynchoides TaxID=125765 RepID=UPI003A99F877